MNNISEQLEVTPITTLKEYAGGELVQFPPFSEDMPFVAKVKRPSMMVLMKTGKIPNSLLSAANALFSGNMRTEEDSELYKEVLGVIEILAEASFVNPTWNELKEAEIELTDEQYTFLFNYIQRGVKALQPFRK